MGWGQWVGLGREGRASALLLIFFKMYLFVLTWGTTALAGSPPRPAQGSGCHPPSDCCQSENYGVGGRRVVLN